jgi:pilus assembly protein CpaB
MYLRFSGDDGATGTLGPPESVDIPVVVAAQDIAAGTKITDETVKVIIVPEELLVAGAYSDTAPVVGQVTNVPVAEREQVTASKLGQAVPQWCCPGKLSFNTEPVTTEGERVLPGNRVDIVIERDGGATTVVENVEVLAVGSEVVTPESQSPATITVTVAVGPEQTQLLTEALGSGWKISLSRPA